jgi:GTP cyclohydrolase I
MKFDLEKISQGMKMIMEGCGITLKGELEKTPLRVARMYEEILAGLKENPADHLRPLVEDEHEEMVILRDIPLYSVCEHHFLPFIGKAGVVYIPRNGVITGVSKLARVVEGYARRPQLQERLTSQIADAIMQKLNPLGVIVVVEASHLCMAMRGVQKPNSKMVTSAIRGIFHDDLPARNEAMSLLR